MIKPLLIACLLSSHSLMAMKYDIFQTLSSIAHYSLYGIGGSLLAWNIYSTKKEIAKNKNEWNEQIKEIKRATTDSKKEYEKMCLRILSYRLQKMLDERLEEEKKVNPHKTMKQISDELIEHELEQCRIKEDLSYLWDFVFSQKKSRRKKLINSIIEPTREDPSPPMRIDFIENEADIDFIHLCASEE